MQKIREVTPDICRSRMFGALRSLGLHIQRWKVREILRKIYPVGTALRWNKAIYRRKYSVPCPNALWHIDGNHKLIQWRLVIHAGIDGYSRLITHLHCSNNNLASTVLDLFKEGVRKYGLLSRTRSDDGLENVEVDRYMLEHLVSIVPPRVRLCARNWSVPGSPHPNGLSLCHRALPSLWYCP